MVTERKLRNAFTSLGDVCTPGCDHMLTKQRKKELMAQMGPQTPSVIIGKNGVTDAILEEIKSQLASKKIVKVSLPQNAEKKEEVVEVICTFTNSTCIDLRGRKVILYRE